MALYKRESDSEILSIVFNATNSTNQTWFSRERLTYSPWTDLYTEPLLTFAIQGCCGRAFYIIRNHGGCADDAGWLVVSNNDCDWERRLPNTTVLYSNRKNFTNVNVYGKKAEHVKNSLLCFKIYTCMVHLPSFPVSSKPLLNFSCMCTSTFRIIYEYQIY